MHRTSCRRCYESCASVKRRVNVIKMKLPINLRPLQLLLLLPLISALEVAANQHFDLRQAFKPISLRAHVHASPQMLAAKHTNQQPELRILPANQLLAALNEQSHSYLTHLAQFNHDNLQRNNPAAFHLNNLIASHRQRGASQQMLQQQVPVSSRRESSVPVAATNTIHNHHPQQQQQHHNHHHHQQQQAFAGANNFNQLSPDSNDGKLLVCYYTNHKSSTHPSSSNSDVQRFVVPADQLDQLVAANLIAVERGQAAHTKQKQASPQHFLPINSPIETGATSGRNGVITRQPFGSPSISRTIFVSPKSVGTFNQSADRQPVAGASTTSHQDVSHKTSHSDLHVSSGENNDINSVPFASIEPPSNKSKQQTKFSSPNGVNAGGLIVSAPHNGRFAGVAPQQQAHQEAVDAQAAIGARNSIVSRPALIFVANEADEMHKHVDTRERDQFVLAGQRAQPHPVLSSTGEQRKLFASQKSRSLADNQLQHGGGSSGNGTNNYFYHFNQPVAQHHQIAIHALTSGAQQQQPVRLQTAESELAPALHSTAAVPSQQLVVGASQAAPTSITFAQPQQQTPPVASATTRPASVVTQARSLADQSSGVSSSAATTSGTELVRFPSSAYEGLVVGGPSSGMQAALLAAAASQQALAHTAATVSMASMAPPQVSSHASDTDAAKRQHQYARPQLKSSTSSSPFSTVFDVFGAASQYLMRFRPSALMSPSALVSLNSGGNNAPAIPERHSSPLAASKQQQQQLLQPARGANSTSLFAALPFTSALLTSAAAAGQAAKSGSTSAIGLPTNQTTLPNSSGYLSRLALQGDPKREDVCGRTIQLPERRIIGGEGARYGEFPYQVHIKIAKHQCGGALVDKQSIVTAAHCVYHFITRAPVSKLQIVIGAYDIEDEQYQELPPQYFKVNKVKLHPNFRFSASHPDRYDIAILKLDKPVKYTDNVLPVCLPSKELKFENLVGTVTGFGKTDPSLSNRYGTRLLQKVDVPIIENGECERWHRTRGIDLKIFPEMMCAGYEDGLKDACVGDSGGPLVVKTGVGANGSFRWTLAGITSAGFGCAQSRQPGIYHRVSHTVDWILENLD